MGKILVIKDADFSAVAVDTVTPDIPPTPPTPSTEEIWYWQPSVEFSEYPLAYPVLTTGGRAQNDNNQNRLRGNIFNTVRFNVARAKGTSSQTIDSAIEGQMRLGKAKLNGDVTVIATINTTLEEYNTIITRTIPETILEEDEYLVVGINGDTVSACNPKGSGVIGFGWYGSIGLSASTWTTTNLNSSNFSGGYIDVGYVPQN